MKFQLIASRFLANVHGYKAHEQLAILIRQVYLQGAGDAARALSKSHGLDENVSVEIMAAVLRSIGDRDERLFPDSDGEIT